MDPVLGGSIVTAARQRAGISVCPGQGLALQLQLGLELPKDLQVSRLLFRHLTDVPQFEVFEFTFLGFQDLLGLLLAGLLSRQSGETYLSAATRVVTFRQYPLIDQIHFLFPLI